MKLLSALLCIIFVAVLSISSSVFVSSQSIPIHQHSLEPPLLFNYEESGFPFWTIGKGTVATNTYVRLTPEKGAGHGYLWNKHPAELKQWKANFTVRSASKTAGAFHLFAGSENCKTCGSAFWHVSDQARHGTSGFFGIPNRFRGVGLVFPSGKNSINIVHSDGTNTVGSLEEVTVAQCPFNLDYTPRLIIVSYAGGFLSVSYAPADRPTYITQCAKNIEVSSIENRYYFGFTAYHNHAAANGMDVMSMKIVGALDSDADESAKANLAYDPEDDKKNKILWDGKPDQPLDGQQQQQQQQP